MRLQTFDDCNRPSHVRWMWVVPRTPRPGSPRTKDRTPSVRAFLAGLLPVRLSLPAEPLIPLTILVILPLFAMTLALLHGPAVIAVSLLSPISSTLIFVIVALLMWVVRAIARHTVRCRAAWLSRGLCPACAYDLPRSGSACSRGVRCPECGGAWEHTPPRVELCVLPSE